MFKKEPYIWGHLKKTFIKLIQENVIKVQLAIIYILDKEI